MHNVGLMGLILFVIVVIHDAIIIPNEFSSGLRQGDRSCCESLDQVNTSLVSLYKLRFKCEMESTSIFTVSGDLFNGRTPAQEYSSRRRLKGLFAGVASHRGARTEGVHI